MDQKILLTNTFLQKLPPQEKRQKFHDTECKYLYLVAGKRSKPFYVYKGHDKSVLTVKIG